MSDNFLIVLSNDEIEEIEGLIGYTFNDKKLLSKAFTHGSFVNENKNAVSNERLEFFGDRILNFLAAEDLFYNEAGDEGQLTLLLKNKVSHIPLTESVKRLGIIDYLKKSKGTKNEGKYVSDLYEALLGAIYADSKDINICRDFILKTLATVEISDYKSLLKEWGEKNKTEVLKRYEENGNETEKRFKVFITVNDQEFFAENKSKDEAEKDASKLICERFDIN